MSKSISTFIALTSICFAATFANGFDNPVSLRAKLAKNKSGETIRDLNILVSIESGWHIYDVPPADGSAKRATIEIQTPDGVETIGEVVRPISFPNIKKPDTKIYQFSASFSQKLKISKDFKGGEIKLKLDYQVCNDKLCRPVDSLETSVKIPAVAGNTKAKDLFEEPIMLMVGTEPLNKAARQMYPSPAIFDIDNDGQNELIVGDIFGTLNVYENQNDTGNGDPVWSRHKTLESSDGKPIKVKNW